MTGAPVTLKQALAALQKAGTAQNRKIYTNHGAVLPLFGVSYAELNKLKKSLGTDQDLADGLWQSGHHDARILACMVADAAAMTSRQFDAWARDLGDYIICDAMAKVVSSSPLAGRKAAIWRERKSEFVAALGWDVTGLLALDPASDLTDEEAGQLIDQIAREIHDRPNRTRHSMNQALICLGVRKPRLHEKAVAAARKIGRVEVDHGATSCQTPEAIGYMEKTLAHRAQKAKKTGKAKP
jgi:3-methyladenine DNA glycosylase AlkD